MTLFRNVLAVLIGAVIGGVVNMGLVTMGPIVIPPPEGADVTTMEGLAKSIHLFEARHFVFPFLAHAVGTFVGAAIAYKVSVSLHKQLALVVGGFFMLGGITNAFMLPAPIWFITLDISLAYIPMALLAIVLFTSRESTAQA